MINTKTQFYTDKKLFELFCIENDFARYFAKFCNLFILKFCFAYYDNFSKWYISILQDKSYFLTFHNSKKCFPCTRVYQIGNECFEWLIVVSICYFRLGKKRCLKNFCSIKKWVMVVIVDKNVFKIMTLLNNLVLIWRFYKHSFVFCSLYTIREISVFC